MSNLAMRRTMALTRAFSPRRNAVARTGRFLASPSESFSSSNNNTSSTPTTAIRAEEVVESAITKRMRVESEQEMANIVERVGDMKNLPTRLCTTREQVRDYMDQYDVNSILFDCDGVVYRSPDPAPGARTCIQSLLLDNEKQIFFVTNNAESNRVQLRDKLANILDMNNDDDDNNVQLTENVMVPSSFSAAQYVKQQFLGDDKQKTTSGRLFVIGSKGLCDELRQAGFTIFGGNDNDDYQYETTSMSRDELAAYDFPEHPIDVVAVGHDINLHFRKLAIAQVLLQKNPAAQLVATNTDAFDLVGAKGYEIPGNGGAVSYLEHTTRCTAVNCGKPSPILTQVMQDKYGLDTSRSLFVGDRLDTDIQFGMDTGMHTALVLTGVTTGRQMADILQARIQHQQDGDEQQQQQHPQHAIPSIILPHMALLV